MSQPKIQSDDRSQKIFADLPVRQAVITMVVPTVISQMITVVYNMADTFFIGQINDPTLVAATALQLPIYIFLTALSNLFGIGGASFLARALGKNDAKAARRGTAFTIWGVSMISLLYGLIFFFFRDPLFLLLGANDQTIVPLRNYIIWTMTVGALPTALSMALSQLVRAEGYAKQASFGIAMGGIINMLLDPLFIFGFNLSIAGAGIATMLSNVLTLVYFVWVIRKRHGQTSITFDPSEAGPGDGVARDILLVGLPSFIMGTLSVLSNIAANVLIATYSTPAVAGLGISKKVDMMAFAIGNGMSQGVLPLIAYNYAAENYKRMRDSLKTALTMSVAIAAVGTVILFPLSGTIAKTFIADTASANYGSFFLQRMILTAACTSVTVMAISFFQAIGETRTPMFLSLCRKGGLDVPLMLGLNALFGLNGIALAFPIADFLAMTFAALLLWRSRYKLQGVR